LGGVFAVASSSLAWALPLPYLYSLPLRLPKSLLVQDPPLFLVQRFFWMASFLPVFLQQAENPVLLIVVL